jgi:multidrug efflux pump subunit AcrB
VLARFFVDRPVFAWVISIVITLAGVVAGYFRPIAQYPEITPPTISVSCVYPGANAEVVANTVAAPIEQQVNGVERMLYMSSNSGNDGSYSLTVTFEIGTDVNMAQVLVQNRIQLAIPQLPEEVQRQGLTVRKRSPDILLVVNLYSPDGSKSQLDLSNYATINLRDEMSRISGVGDVTIIGQQDYAMRVWLDPDRMTYYGLTAPDVVKAIREQNVQVAAGQIGQEPAPPGQAFTFTVSTLGRLSDPEQFRNIVVKIGSTPGATPSGGAPSAGASAGPVYSDDPLMRARPVVLLRDVARVELAARNMDIRNTMDGQPTAGLAIFQLPGSNALETADNVKKRMNELSRQFPTGIAHTVRYDTTPFIRQSVDEVFNTLRDAVILVAIVVLFFLQDWRAMILPMIDVPVALTGTFIVMSLLGFSLNNLTLLGLVLAIGIVVDDAIVVLENIERWIAQGEEPRTATIHAMGEITGPIIAITLVLSSVFLPSAFLGGVTGQFYRQFALTIAAAMMISAINAMTLTPARAVSIFKNSHQKEALPWWGVCGLLGWLTLWLCERFLGPHLGLIAGENHPTETPSETPNLWVVWLWRVAFFVPGAVAGWFLTRPINSALAWVFKWFNRGFSWITERYGRTIAVLLRISLIVLIVYGGLLVLTYFGITRTPTGFIPFQDRGYLLVSVQLPDAASVQRTSEILAKVDKIARKTPGVAHTVGIAGQSSVLGANGGNFASMYVTLDDFDARAGDRSLNAFAIYLKLQAELRREIEDATIMVFPPPPVSGIGTAGGYRIMVQARQGQDPHALQTATDRLVRQIGKTPGAGTATTQFRATIPQLYADIDRRKCKQLGVSLEDVFATLQTYLGGTYVNDFNKYGRTWQVYAQADAPYRINADYVRNFRVRNDRGQMVPLGALATIEDTTGPVSILRYNMFVSASVNGNLPQGTSTSEGVALVTEGADEALPSGFSTEWTELFFLQIREGNAAIYAFLGAVILVYLILAAQYESWSLPLAIILVVPMCLLSAIAGVRLAGIDINIFVQVAFIVLVGLAAKNAILIVEFAQEQRREGLNLRDATLKAVRLRLRPIIMTSFAFIFGVVPLVLATGAGAEMRATMGVAVFSGMIGVTFFGIMLTPIFYYVIEKYASGTGPLPPSARPHGVHSSVAPG